MNTINEKEIIHADFGALYQTNPHDAEDFMCLLLVDSVLTGKRVAFLESIQANMVAQPDDFDVEIAAVGKVGVLDALREQHVSFDRLDALSRHPSALARACEALCEAEEYELSPVEPEADDDFFILSAAADAVPIAEEQIRLDRQNDLVTITVFDQVFASGISLITINEQERGLLPMCRCKDEQGEAFYRVTVPTRFLFGDEPWPETLHLELEGDPEEIVRRLLEMPDVAGELLLDSLKIAHDSESTRQFSELFRVLVEKNRSDEDRF